jgi:multiple sugar transport system substrate-binding protein
MKKMFKKSATTVFSVVLAATLVVGCGVNQGSKGNDSQSTQGNTEQPLKGKKVTLLLANHPWGEMLKELVPDFEKATGINVDVQSYFEDQLDQKVSVQLTSGSSNPDVFMYRPTQQAKLYAKNEWTEPLNTYATNDSEYDLGDFFKSALGSTTVEEKLHGIPILTEREIIYYRKDILEKENIPVPTTFEELEAAAQKLHDPKNEFYGFVARGQRTALITRVASYLYSEGGDWMTDGKASVNSPEAIKAFTYYGSLIKNYGPPGVLNFNWPQVIGMFAQGQAAFASDADSLYTNAIDPEKSKVVGHIGYAQLPAGDAGSRPTNAAGWGIAMSSKSDEKTAAWELIKWATSKEIMLELQKKGSPGARQSVMDNPEGAEGFPPELYAVMKASIETGVAYDRPQVISVGEARHIIGEIVQKVIEGEQNIQAVADQANKAFQDIIDKDNLK